MDNVADALMMPESLKSGANHIERIHSLCRIAEPLLGVDYEAGERAWMHKQMGGWLFVTKDPEDTMYFPTGSGLDFKPRYRWLATTDGIKLGFLTDEAKAWIAQGNTCSPVRGYSYPMSEK